MLVLAIRCALDPIAREETREETWRARGVEDEDENECFDDVDRDPRAVLARRVMERSGKTTEGFVVAARRAWARCATEFLLDTANEGEEREGKGEEEEKGDGARARWRRDGMFEPGPWEMVRRVRALARRAFEDAGDEDAGDDVERWCVEVFLEELDLATVSLDALERCFEDARAVVLNARVDEFDDALGLEMWGLEEWTPTSTFLKTCHLGFTSAPFEATTELLRTTRAYLDAAVRVENGIRDGCDWREARREDDAFRACAAPDALMALACRATARYDARGVDADAVLPRHRLDVLAELAPEMPTIHYLKHAEALHRIYIDTLTRAVNTSTCAPTWDRDAPKGNSKAPTPDESDYRRRCWRSRRRISRFRTSTKPCRRFRKPCARRNKTETKRRSRTPWRLRRR